jgi:hypothetical protein
MESIIAAVSTTGDESAGASSESTPVPVESASTESVAPLASPVTGRTAPLALSEAAAESIATSLPAVSSPGRREHAEAASMSEKVAAANATRRLRGEEARVRGVPVGPLKT